MSSVYSHEIKIAAKEPAIRLAALAFLGGVLLVQQLAALPSLWWALLLPPLLWLAARRPPWFIPVFFVAGVVWRVFAPG